jgi:hypothetical protein
VGDGQKVVGWRARRAGGSSPPSLRFACGSSPSRPANLLGSCLRRVTRYKDGPDLLIALVRAPFPLVPPAGIEPAHPAPEAGALSPELRGPIACPSGERGEPD